MAFEQNQFHACRISEAMRFAPEQTRRRPWTSMWLRPPSGVYAFMYLLAGLSGRSAAGQPSIAFAKPNWAPSLA